MRNWQKWVFIVGTVSFFVLTVITSFSFGVREGRNTPIVDIKHDTLIVVHRDTISVSKPIFYESRVIDTFVVFTPEYIHDTIRLPMEQKHYRDTSYEAWVSGYKPNLDSVKVYQRTQLVTITNTEVQRVKSQPKFGVGFQAGYGFGIQGGQPVTVPYVGVGLTYNLFSF